ncbi:MAG: immunity 7 family protein [Akkermansiaceae bacterium]|jgi:hypothetical protein|nr:immunity 7 family protein [Akkermansiaceae bacterium]
MFEFHGWATIHADDLDDPCGDELAERERSLTRRVQDAIHEVEAANREFHLHRLNGTLHLVFCGDHNHRDESIIEFFRGLSEIAPHSYGKLHVRDDEDTRGFENIMREWTLARGHLRESTDKNMSPCIPTLEHKNP